LPIVIDPILQSTYLGGSGNDHAYALAIHPTTGDVYVAGSTSSTDFPNTTGGAQATYGDYWDAFVARLNSNLTSIIQSTYLGGSSSEDRAGALAIHPTTGDVYVAGTTWSTDFPRTSGGAQESCSSCSSGPSEAFVARLSADLRTLHQSTYLGGSYSEETRALAIGPAPNYDVYVAGETLSTDFPRTSGGAQATYGGGFWDAFVARLSADLRTLHQSTYLGGSNGDGAYALAIHPTTGDVYVAGWTWSTNFPRTTDGAQNTCNNCSVSRHDAFVARLNSDLTSIIQSTYLGGSNDDFAFFALTIGPAPNYDVYVAGKTSSNDFPGTSGGRRQALEEAAPTPLWRG
jgi:hypothetical protein